MRAEAANSVPPENLPAPARGQGSWFKKSVLVLVSATLLAHVLYSADWTQMRELFDQLNPWWFVASFLTVPIMVGLSVLKWQVLLEARGSKVGLWRLVGLYVIGQFYNSFLPTSAGGDLVRVVLLHRHIRDGQLALASVLVERFTGLAVLVLLALTAIVFAPHLWANPMLVLLVSAGSAMALGAVVVVASRSLTRLLKRLVARLDFAGRMLDKVLRFQDSLWLFRQRPRAMLIAIVLSIGFYLAAVLGVWLACLAFGQLVSFAMVLLIVPMVLVVTLLPITLGGLGLWEWAFTASFAAFGLAGALGLSASLLLRVRDVLWTVGGYAIVSLTFLRSATAAEGVVVSSSQPEGAASSRARGC